MSKVGKTDEFYTQLSTIEDELRHYRKYFKDKVVFCNADDPALGENEEDNFGDGLGGYTSNFFRYFQLNFHQLGIKKLITTHYEADKPSYKFEIVSTDENDQIGIPEYVKTPLQGNGDFRSPECLELLEECDIVVTNPPFSLMKEYLPLIINSGKQFLTLGNMNHAIIREIFGYFKENRVWLGYKSGHFWFRVPDYYEEKPTDFKIDETGQKWRRMGNICWFTNMDIDKRHQPLDLFMRYTQEKYPKYDQYDAINVNKTTDIPEDYDGIMGVPITFLDKYSPDQFEMIGVDRYVEDNPHYGRRFTINGKETYARILIRRKQA
ncbi:modification methylase [Paenibacillus popilliae]|uniref:Modification methylase n=2 Tax=Paenibacillus popilliae TaxID=78057 RepID=A0ABY3AHC3_PAEPP|nr:modification methylase [Paenibacillus sp. SDF0028]